MHDIKKIEENPTLFDEALQNRGVEKKSAWLLEKQNDRKKVITKIQALKQKRNSLSKRMRIAKKYGESDESTSIVHEVNEIKDLVVHLENDLKNIESALDEAMIHLPNIPLEDVPVGKDEHANVEISQWGAKHCFPFSPRPHYEVGEQLGMMDFDQAAKISGARFVILSRALAKLERALVNFMIDVHTKEFGYEEILVPLLVKEHAMYGTAQLPKFAFDQFSTQNNLWLIPTAEVPLTNLVREKILSEKELPKRFVTHSPCFRLEAGSAGKDTRGMIRQHQFSKVELVSIVTQELAATEHKRMLRCAQSILEKLELHYRTILLCTGDMGFSSQKTYDLEVWMPSDKTFREISSCSVCGDFQARRMNARYRNKESGNIAFVTTLNGSALAIGRTIVAILENYQEKNGSVRVPDVLQAYTNYTHISKSCNI